MMKKTYLCGSLATQPLKIAILGPTGSGKSYLAARVAAHVGGTVVNGDPFQAYAALPIGTGQPTAEEQGGVLHLGYGNLDLNTPLDPAGFGAHVRAQLNSVAFPVLVTGSGLYLRAIWEQLTDVPSATTTQVAKVRNWLDQLGPEVLHRYLGAIDPFRAAQLHPRDGARLQRALSLHLQTGMRPSQLLTGIARGVPSGWRTLLVMPSRETLRGKIAKRVNAMVAAGWQQEVQKIVQNGQEEALRRLRPLGYTEWLDLPAATVPDRIIQQTQQYAKRQCTFFRNQWPETPTWDPECDDVAVALQRLELVAQ